MANELIIDKNNGILKLTMNRPDRRNALNQAMLDSLYDELIKAENDSSVRVIVLTGAGNAFALVEM